VIYYIEKTCPVTYPTEPEIKNLAVVSLAAVINYLKLTKKNVKDLKLVINGAGY